MGRNKLVLKRLETSKERQSKFSKRKHGIVKKAKEISVMCDVDLALFMFSPTAKPITFFAHNKDLNYFVEKLEETSVQVREERRDSTNQLLKKIFEREAEAEAAVDVGNFFGNGNHEYDTVKSYESQLDEVKKKLYEKRKIMEEWENPETVQDLNQIRSMKQHLIASMAKIKKKKSELLEKLCNSNPTECEDP